MYAIGFVVIAIHDGAYGIVLFDFLRSRVLSAGVLFVVYLVMPILAASREFGLFGLSTRGPTIRVEPEREKYLNFAMACYFYLPALVLAVPASFLFVRIPILTGMGTLIWAVLLLVLPRLLFDRLSKRMPVASCVVCAIGLLASMALVFTRMEHDFFFLGLWFYATGIAFVLLYRTLGDSSLRMTTQWERSVTSVIAVVLFFAGFIYGRVRVQFGGGAPMPITLHFTIKNPMFDGGQIQVLLVDETDRGYYVIQNSQDTKAYFVPRSTVAGVVFSRTGGEPASNLTPATEK